MRALLPSAAVLLALATTGCLTSRSIRSVSEHPTRPLTLIQTQDTLTYVPGFYSVSKHQFWSCSQQSDQLTCRKVCDAQGRQLDCPTGSVAAASNSNQISTR